MLQTGVGVKTGAKVNKFKEMKLTKQKADFLSCPMINESPVSVECKVKEIKELGSHHMFIAEVLAIHADEKYIDEKGAFDISKCDLIAYSNGGYYSLGEKMGKFGFSVEKKKNRNNLEKSRKVNNYNTKDKKISHKNNNLNPVKKTDKLSKKAKFTNIKRKK